MITATRKITEAQYERAVNNNNCLVESDFDSIFSLSEQIGYGIYYYTVTRDENDQPIVKFKLGESCD